MTRLSGPTAVLAAVLVLLLAGCAPSFPNIEVTTEPTNPINATPDPAPTAVANPADCTNVLDDASIATFESQEYVLSADFAERAIDQNWPLAAFVTNGGLLCQWGYPQSDGSEYFGLSEITPDQKTAEVARLEAEGYSLEPHADGELYVGPPIEGGINDNYLFAGGHWFVGFSTARIDEIRRNAGLG